MPADLATVRERIVAYLRAELVGPRWGALEVLAPQEVPNRTYVAGMLFPRNASNDPVISEEDTDVAGADGAADVNMQDVGDDPVALANQYLPASMGISFYLQGSSGVRVRVRGARYERDADDGSARGSPSRAASTVPEAVAEPEEEDGEVALDADVGEQHAPTAGRERRGWRRVPFEYGFSDDDELLLQTRAHDRVAIAMTPAAELRLHAVWRDAGDGWLVTVTVINPAETHDSRSVDPTKCLFQVELQCRPLAGGSIRAFPRSRLLTEDREEHILDLLYRREAAYGVGHGCSVVWDTPRDGQVAWIASEVLPEQAVPSITYEQPGFDEVLTLQFLAGGERYPERLLRALQRFVDGYRSWSSSLADQHRDIPADLADAREELLGRLAKALDRMDRGIRLLGEDDKVMRAFCLANEAMLMQMVHSHSSRAGSRRVANSQPYKVPDLEEPGFIRRWRPFQLAFQLLTLTSIVNEDDPDRMAVDLIWFPTGGGKTEAYLAVTAFLIFYRRMTHGEAGGGTAVLMRYTLRLLTAQQFRRAATLVCACELIRQRNPADLGAEAVAIGLWVGDGATPNRFGKAKEQLQNLLVQDRPKSPFQIDRCPWCGTELVPEARQDDRQLYGIEATLTEFHLFCPTLTCPFREELPISVVDDDLYERPPTLLIGTVDKFARLPWEARAGAFFGEGRRRPPELIIQDELHLISGPLGTIVGIYETAIDALASWDGCPPKLLASTATIRRADEQCLGLYSREVQLFPPSGLDASDSYFARYDRSSPGRHFAGVLAASHTGSTAVIRVAAALLQAPNDLQLTGADADAYWTLVAYHNSLRELGKSVTFGNDDIPARIKVVAQDRRDLRLLTDSNVQELTSNTRAEELTEILTRLEHSATDHDEISLLLCTNMLSVGVDVQRLGLMLVNGQPKSTSEYIQATSRVGRGAVPGLIVTVYSPSKPRDRSHYERFVAYHQALYRHVEPTSVTPFARPARDRALHAVLVALVRHRGGLPDENDAARFRQTNPCLARISSWIRDRVAAVDPREARAAAQDLERRIVEWQRRAEADHLLYYQSPQKQKTVLLRTPGDGHTDGWDTLQSMRNVDRSCLIKVM